MSLKGVVIGVCLSLSLCGFGQPALKNVTLEDIWTKGTFRQKSVMGINSMKDGIHFTSLKNDKEGNSYIVKFDYRTGNVIDTLVGTPVLKLEGKESKIVFDSYSFSADEKLILLSTETEPIYRHSTRSMFYVFDIQKKRLAVLSEGGKQQLAAFSPTGNMVSFVRDNNLFIKDITSENEWAVTIDGKLNEIINGIPDWVYEEEFSFSKAYEWSGDGSRIAYMRFDEREVPEFSMAMYGKLYPFPYTFKYPKAGEKNSVVSVHIYDLSSRNTVRVETGAETDNYLPRIKWTQDPSKLSVTRLNRHQNKLELLLADALTGKTTIMLKEENKYYIDITDDLTFLGDGRHFIWTSEKDGYNHIYLYNISGALVRQLTRGNFEVLKFYGIDEKSKTLFFQSAEVSPLEKHLYSISVDGKNKKKISEQKGTNGASFSSTFQYYINFHTSSTSPTQVTLHESSGKQMRILEDNEGLRKTLSEYHIVYKEFFKITLRPDLQLNAWMIKPKNFDPSKRHPVLMFVYGGPGSQTVGDSWDPSNFMWYQMLADKGYIIVSVDNRGTGARGEEFKKNTYLELGKKETEDQMAAGLYLSTLGYVDPARIGIWGWSYGGYMSTLCITKGADIFKAAIAVAPVTSWRYYDSIYTERFLRTPQENPKGYDENSPIEFADQIRGKYLLVHGSADDNVHYQNAMEMTNALVRKNRPFDMFIYPDRNHGISGGTTRLHLYNKMTSFILDNL
jgi:dipeptidyl-peptidase 4